MIVVKDTDVRRAYRGAEILSALSKYPIKFDLLFYTNRELRDGLAKEYSFIQSVWPSGVCLYEKP